MTEQLAAAEAGLGAFQAGAERIRTGPAGRQIVWHCWGEGQPVVFFHGASGSWRHWIRQVEAFRGRARLIVADLPGFGLSDMPAMPLDFPAMAAEVAAGLDQIIGSEAVYDLVAFSYGGSITAEILQRDPGRQRRIALCAPAGFGRPLMPQMRKVRGLEGEALRQAHHDNLGSIMIADPARIDPMALCIQMLNSGESRLRLNGVARTADLAEGLAACGSDVTLIWGTRDAFMPEDRLAERMARVADRCPDVRVSLIEGAGHWVAYEAAGQVNALLEKSLFDC
ncbi:alpha/beta fold hydrolase [Oceanicola sp. 22II-s10i]|uniref:alpha/beta fold hydrolase n=1 Tax=Oceanicola sp. 22II-s10i TaxID=1317116 RepID=UPI001C3E0603|nr:alpha/beta fold hydrolase [Oceanicola sp. 22II-s10i]